MMVKRIATKQARSAKVRAPEEIAIEKDSSPARLLTAAERIIIDEGISALSIRRIANMAGLNSQLVGYYFGGMAELIEALLDANLDPINVQRRKMLAALTANGRQPDIDGAMEAFLRPMWREAAYCPGVHANVILTEIMTNGPVDLRDRAMSKVRLAYHELASAFAPLLPQLNHSALLWRICCISGSIIAVATPRLYSPRFFGPVDDELPDFHDEQWYRELFAFAKGAILAPPAPTA